jgi:hypothetical protein
MRGRAAGFICCSLGGKRAPRQSYAGKIVWLLTAVSRQSKPIATPREIPCHSTGHCRKGSLAKDKRTAALALDLDQSIGPTLAACKDSKDAQAAAALLQYICHFDILSH